MKPPVLERHRLAVLHAHGYTDEWLNADGREKHLIHRWLKTGVATVGSNAEALFDRLALANAEAEAFGKGERAATQEAISRIADRVQRAINDELVEPLAPEPPVLTPELKQALFALSRTNLQAADNTGDPVAVRDVILAAVDVVAAFTKQPT